MKLNLTVPVVFLDIEATGLDIVTDRIVELAFLKVMPNGSEQEKVWRFNPGMPIAPDAYAVHGISDEDVKNEPDFKQHAKQVAQFLDGCCLAGFNANRFDLPLLAEEFLRAEVEIDLKRYKLIDAQAIFHKMEKRTLTAAYKFYCNKPLENAHSAMADVRATYEVLKAQLDCYDNKVYYDDDEKKTNPFVIKNDAVVLSEFSAYHNSVDFAGRLVYNAKNEVVFNFGKYKGVAVEEVFVKDPGYYSWFLNGDFPLYTKRILTALKLKSRT